MKSFVRRICSGVVNLSMMKDLMEIERWEVSNASDSSTTYSDDLDVL